MDEQFRVDKEIFLMRDSICCDVVWRSLVALKCLMLQDETDNCPETSVTKYLLKKCNIAEGR
jgi:hypothetical protein